MSATKELFSLEQRTVLITGGAGLLGPRHAIAILDAGGTAILVDINRTRLKEVVSDLKKTYGVKVFGYVCDITNENRVKALFEKIKSKHGFIHVLINNAANNPHVTAKGMINPTRFEQFSLRSWNEDFAVGVSGAFLMSKYFGHEMAQRRGGVIINIASELSITAPFQRLYRQKNVADDKQPVKPVSYSVVKHGLVGLTKYLATYWADKNVRVNAVSFGGVQNGQPAAFLRRINKLIPLGRMAQKDEYQGVILFLSSEASSYMTGSNVVIDGGRTVW